ncbi:MAG TPA: nucleoside phosphorylase [Bacteroidales bacterium]|nr:nucleoside phosphorylase [Bacteroidales bacterium]
MFPKLGKRSGKNAGIHFGKAVKGLSSSAWLTDDHVLICGQMGIGAPSAVVLLEELIAEGIKNIISFGTAGTLHDDLHAGDLVVCSEAFPDEGTSGHYIQDPGPARPSQSLMNEMIRFLGEKGIVHKNAIAWTTDAPFRETHEKLQHFLGLGANVVEMEASALYHVAAYRNIDLLALFVIGDSIAGGSWKPAFTDTMVRESLWKNSFAMIEFLSLL